MTPALCQICKSYSVDGNNYNSHKKRTIYTTKNSDIIIVNSAQNSIWNTLCKFDPYDDRLLMDVFCYFSGNLKTYD
jgi:hypothetical protein